jgi:MFS family permease
MARRCSQCVNILLNSILKGSNELIRYTNSAPYIASAVLGCWLSDPLNNLLGRRGAIFISAIFCVLSPIGSACTQTWPQLFVARLLLGIGMGVKASTVPIFCAENTPAPIRGGLVMCWQMYVHPPYPPSPARFPKALSFPTSRLF